MKELHARTRALDALFLAYLAKVWRKRLQRREAVKFWLLVKIGTVCNLNRWNITLCNLSSAAFLSGRPPPHLTWQEVQGGRLFVHGRKRCLRAFISTASNLITTWLLIQVHLDNFLSFHNSFIYLRFNAFPLKSSRCWLFNIIIQIWELKRHWVPYCYLQW